MPEREPVTTSVNKEDSNLRHRKGSEVKIDNSNLASNGSDIKELENTKMQYMPRCSTPVHKNLKESPLSSDAIFQQVAYVSVLFALHSGSIVQSSCIKLLDFVFLLYACLNFFCCISCYSFHIPFCTVRFHLKGFSNIHKSTINKYK